MKNNKTTQNNNNEEEEAQEENMQIIKNRNRKCEVGERDNNILRTRQKNQT